MVGNRVQHCQFGASRSKNFGFVKVTKNKNQIYFSYRELNAVVCFDDRENEKNVSLIVIYKATEKSMVLCRPQ